MYGQSFSLANNQENGLNAATYGGGEAGDFTRARGFLSYYEVFFFFKLLAIIIVFVNITMKIYFADLSQHSRERLESCARQKGKNGTLCLPKRPVGIIRRSSDDPTKVSIRSGYGSGRRNDLGIRSRRFQKPM